MNGQTTLSDTDRAKLEEAATNRIHAALQDWGKRLFRGVTDDTAPLILARLDDPEFNKPFRDAFIAVLQSVADEGVDMGRRQVEEGISGRKNILDDFFDWALANTRASAWAIQHGAELVRRVTDTTRKQIAGEIRYFVENSITINQLRDRLMGLEDIEKGPFGLARARTIAVTEVTRAYASGNLAAWQEAGIVQKMRWLTAKDDRVCGLCGPLHGQVVELGQPFSGPGGNVAHPPRHVGCRCDISPVIELPTTHIMARR